MTANLTRGNSITDHYDEFWEREIEYCRDSYEYYYKKYWLPETASRPQPIYHELSPTLNLLCANVQF